MSDRVLVARIRKPHGIRGEVALETLSDVAGRFEPGAVLTDPRGRSFTVATTRPHQGRLLVKFDEVADRNDAERIRGVELFAEPVSDDASDTYYVQEILGMQVRAEDGRDLGIVSDVIDLPTTAGYDLLEVRRPDATTWLLPAVDDLVAVEIAPDGSEYLQLVDTPAGLVDPENQEEPG